MSELPHDSVFLDTIEHTFTAAEVALIKRAYGFARERINDGDSTPFQAAELLYAQDADARSVVSALLAPLVWQRRADLTEIRDHFGATVTAALERLLSLSLSLFTPDTNAHSQKDVHAFLASLGGDLDRALLFISFRLLALEHAIDLHVATSREMARETLDLLVPIADRLSLGYLRRRLEDACFRILDPSGYESLKKIVAPIQAEDDKCLDILLTGVQRLLDNNGIRGRVQGRTKSLHGIWRKMKRTSKTVHEIMDRIGLRVIVALVPECYTVLGLLHSHFKPIPGTFNDYIGLPKDNGYQSLHTCVYPVREISHKPIEIQVRTELMHAEAEHGTAAHWRYKVETAKAEQQYRAQWMEGLERQYEKTEGSEAFIDLLHRQVFQNSLVVFGNGGRIVRLADKATVRDYLTITNTDVTGGKVVKVNGRTAGMDVPLRDGDSIEVAAGGNSFHPDGTEDGGTAVFPAPATRSTPGRDNFDSRHPPENPDRIPRKDDRHDSVHTQLCVSA